MLERFLGVKSKLAGLTFAEQGYKLKNQQKGWEFSGYF